MNQPSWKLIANLGDRHPIDYGGFFVYEDTTGVYPPEAELLISPDSDESKEPWMVYRFCLEPCTWINGVLSDNRFHPDNSAWFAHPFDPARPQDGKGGLIELSEFNGIPVEDLITLFCSADSCQRAEAWRMVGEFHGWENLDSYPLTFKDRAEVESRYQDEMEASR